MPNLADPLAGFLVPAHTLDPRRAVLTQLLIALVFRCVSRA